MTKKFSPPRINTCFGFVGVFKSAEEKVGDKKKKKRTVRTMTHIHFGWGTHTHTHTLTPIHTTNTVSNSSFFFKNMFKRIIK